MGPGGRRCGRAGLGLRRGGGLLLLLWRLLLLLLRLLLLLLHLRQPDKILPADQHDRREHDGK